MIEDVMLTTAWLGWRFRGRAGLQSVLKVDAAAIHCSGMQTLYHIAVHKTCIPVSMDWSKCRCCAVITQLGVCRQ